MVGFPCFNVPSTFFGGLELLLVSKHMHRGLNRPSGHNVMRCMGNSIRAKLQQKSNTSICCFQSVFESEVCSINTIGQSLLYKEMAMATCCIA